MAENQKVDLSTLPKGLTKEEFTALPNFKKIRSFFTWAYVVSFTEMFYIGQQLSAAQKSLLPLFVAGAFYYVFNFVIAFIMEKVEKKFNYYQ